MSLLSVEMVDCVILDKTTTQAADGSIITKYTDGAKIKANIGFEDSIEARAAMQSGVKNVYTVLTDKSVLFEYHDVFRRETDGKVFRVTSDGEDKVTPAISKLNLRAVSAEEFAI